MIVPPEVGPQGAHHDHSDHTRKEQHNHERVDDGEPMDLSIGILQVHIPSGCPSDRIVLLPVDAVRPNNVLGGGRIYRLLLAKHLGAPGSLVGIGHLIPVLNVVVVAHGVHFKSKDNNVVSVHRTLAIYHVDIHMVIYENLSLLVWIK